MSPDPLEHLWTAMLDESACFTGSEVSMWSDGMFKLLQAAGIVVEGATVTHVECDACCDGHTEQVDRVPRKRGKVDFYIYCPQAGRVQVPTERLRQWKVSIAGLAKAIGRGLGLAGEPSPLAGSQAWRLGDFESEAGVQELLLARCMTDIASVGTALSDKAVVLVAQRPIVIDGSLTSHVIALADVVALRDGKLAFDSARLARMIGSAQRPSAVPAPRPDGVYPPRTIVYRGVEYDCELTRQEMTFLTLALTNVETDIGTLMHRGKNAVWRSPYTATKAKRNKVSRLLTRLNAKLLDASPSLQVTFSMRRGTPFLTRDEGPALTKNTAGAR